MTIFITEQDQQQVNELRIDLAQVGVYLAELNVQDLNNRHTKERAIEILRKMRDSLDHLGIRHSSAKRYANGRP